MGHRPVRVLLCYHRCPIYGFRFNEIQGQGEVEIRNAGLVVQRTGVSHIPDWGNRH